MFNIILLFISFLFTSDFNVYNIPVQENGRIKPLDTFAQNQLLSIYGKRSLSKKSIPDTFDKNNFSAVDWLIDISLYPEEADKYKLFNIRNPEIVGSLGLKWDTNHLYSRSEILIGLQNQLDYIQKVQQLPNDQLIEFDKQMLSLYNNAIRFQEISYSFTCILNLIPIDDIKLAKIFDVELGTKISFYNIMKKANQLIAIAEEISSKDIINWSKSDTATSILLNTVHLINQDNFAQSIRIIPPSEEALDQVWLSPWTIMDGRKISESQEQLLNIFSNFLNAKLIGDSMSASKYLNEYKLQLNSITNIINLKNIEYESFYNRINFFYKSIIFYILSFFILCISWMKRNNFIYNSSYTLLLFGLAFHLSGIILRIIIMQRPPISTLYESVIFVSAITIICASILEYNRKDGIGIFTGSVCGIILHFVSFGYADDGDTMGMLVAVLNSNFWLATHVTTITTGYGASLFAGIIGHIYLIRYIINPKQNQYLKTIYSNLYGATLFALFFTMFGTILGGIWADQSWGRFWGWDPKENGALLIVLWQIMMLHLKIMGSVKALGFALGMALNNIIVILAWFGVNLLSVGLHSYGFAEGIAKNIFIFIIIELILCFGLYSVAKNKLVNSIDLK